MRVTRRINNNVVIAVDSAGQEIIVFGKGIGFHEIPYELTDMSLIQRTFYGIHKNYYSLVNEIPEDMFVLASRIVDGARNRLNCKFNPNIIFTLADHINYVLIRIQKGMFISYPVNYDFEHLYSKVYEVSISALRLIEKNKKVSLPEAEAIGIAMHIINNMQVLSNDVSDGVEQISNDIIKIIESERNIKIDKKSFNYSRFMTHLQYLLKRKKRTFKIKDGNIELFESMKEQYPQTFICVSRIQLYTSKKLNWKLNDEELLYLMLHVNRLCSREDCY